MSFNPFSALTSKLFAAISGLLLIALGVMLLIHKHDLAKEDRLTTALAQSEARLAVSNGSIELLQAKIAEMNADTARRAAEFASAQKQAAADGARLAEKAKGSDALIARLRAQAAQPSPDCIVSKDLKREAEGL